jgi:hypothetical protein
MMHSRITASTWKNPSTKIVNVFSFFIFIVYAKMIPINLIGVNQVEDKNAETKKLLKPTYALP